MGSRSVAAGGCGWVVFVTRQRQSKGLLWSDRAVPCPGRVVLTGLHTCVKIHGTIHQKKKSVLLDANLKKLTKCHRQKTNR